MRQFLSNIFMSRWRWVEIGIDNFRQGLLRLDITNHIKPEVMIGVYGPTQVGKTTLILNLLGIYAEKLASLSETLRGGRQLGKSSTVTAIVYQQSLDDRFVIVLPGIGPQYFKNLDELRNGIKELRCKAETGSVDASKPVVIQIPKPFFDQDKLKKRSHDIKILDLPGDDSRDQAEKTHVDNCLKTFLPQCHICILLEIADNMQALTQICRSHVSDWRLFPDFFRIVFTYSVTSLSVQGNVIKGNIYSTKSFCEFFQNEFNRCCDGINPAISIYPLEFGDSWSSVKKTNPEVFKKAELWIEELYDALIDDLCTVQSLENIVQQLRGMINYISNKEEAELKGFVQKNKALRDEIKCKNREVEDENKRQVSMAEENERMDEDIKNVNYYHCIEPNNEEFSCMTSHWCWENANKHSVSWIRSQFYLANDNLLKIYQKNISAWKEKIKRYTDIYSIDIPEMEYQICEAEFIDVNYTWDLFLIKDNFNRDCNRCIKQLSDANKKTLDSINKACDKVIKEVVMYIELYKKNNNCIIKRSKKKQHVLVDETLVLFEKQVELEQEKAKVKKEWKADSARVLELDKYLKRALSEELRLVKRNLNSPHTSGVQKWVYHQYCNLLLQDAERVFNNDKKQ